VAGQASGDIIIGNLSAPQISSTAYGNLTTTQYKAAGFMMGGDAYEVTSVTLRLNMGTAGGGNPIVSLWDGAGAPASELFLFTNPPGITTATGTADFVFTAPAGSTLQAGQTYWVHVRPEIVGAGPTWNWNSTNSSNPPTGPGATFVAYSFNGGTSSFYNFFQLDGAIAGGGCAPDLTTGAIAGQPGYGVPNGVLNNDDFFYYLAQFAAGNLAVADLTTGAISGQPGYGVPNGVLNNDDFFYYLAIFAAGC
jgi:hypothetical protein